MKNILLTIGLLLCSSLGFAQGSGQFGNGTPNLAGGTISSGTACQPGIYTTTTQLGSKGATFYADCYAGATADVKINACVTAALAVNGICDATGLGGAQTVASEIDVGDSGGDAVTLLLPVSGIWTGTAVDGTSSVIKQWGNTSIIGFPTGGSDCTFSLRAGGSSNLGYVYQTDTAANHYLYARGFCIFMAAGTNHITANGIGAYLSAAFDNSVWEYITVNDRVDTFGVKIEAVCCSAMLDHVQFQSNFTAGLTPLWINQIDGELKTQALTIAHSSINHPGATFPSIKITDTSTAHVSHINLVNDYIEPSNTDTTTAFITVSGAGAVNVDNLVVHCMAAGATSSVITVDNTTATMLNVNGLSVLKGGATCTYPVAAAISDASAANAQTNTIPTDAAGQIPEYHSGLAYANRMQIVSNGAASASPFSLTGTPFTGGSGTTTFPFFYLNSGAVAPTAFSTSGVMFGMNAPSGFAGNFLECYVNAVACGNITAAGAMIWPSYRTLQNCAGVGTAANPSVVTCSSAAAGAIACSNSATGGTCVVNTSKVTTNSEIIIQQVVDEGPRLSVTCNTATALPAGPLLASKSNGVSFTINLGTVTTNPACFDYWIVN